MDVTLGAVSTLTVQGLRVVALLRGAGAPAVKSVLFWPVSVQPLLLRKTAVVVDGAGVGALPSNMVAVDPKPTRSRICAIWAGPQGVGVAVDPHASAVVPFTKATFPAVALIAVVPPASAVGMGFTPFVLNAPDTK